MDSQIIDILAIPGSLRRCSVNRAALRAAARPRGGGVVVRIDSRMRMLPHFDPDLERDPPEEVVRFREACERAAAILIAVPEYAFGIPGAFKNALDWTVGAGSLSGKPVTVLSVAPPHRGAHVRAALERVLAAIDADAVFRSIPVAESDRDTAGRIVNQCVTAQLGGVVAELADRARTRFASSNSMR